MGNRTIRTTCRMMPFKMKTFKFQFCWTTLPSTRLYLIRKISLNVISWMNTTYSCFWLTNDWWITAYKNDIKIQNSTTFHNTYGRGRRKNLVDFTCCTEIQFAYTRRTNTAWYVFSSYFGLTRHVDRFFLNTPDW